MAGVLRKAGQTRIVGGCSPFVHEAGSGWGRGCGGGPKAARTHKLAKPVRVRSVRRGGFWEVRSQSLNARTEEKGGAGGGSRRLATGVLKCYRGTAVVVDGPGPAAEFSADRGSGPARRANANANAGPVNRLNSKGFIRRNGWIGLVLVLACAGAGSGLLQLARNAVSEAEAVSGWTRTDGVLRELAIVPLPGLARTRYVATAKFTFLADGREQTGSLLFGAVTAADPKIVKARLRPCMIESLARVEESGSGLSYRFSYTPFRQTVPVYYDPSHPSTAHCGQPGTEPPSYGTTLRCIGWLIVGLSALIAVVVANQWRASLQGAGGRRRMAAGRPRPSPADESAWVQRVDQAIAAFEGSNGKGPVEEGCLDSLRVLRTIPAEALLHHERLGLTRSLSEHGFAEASDPETHRIWSAIAELESFHREWRDKAG